MNPHKGEVPLKVGDKEYTLKLTTNALCELEIRLGKSLQEIVIEASKSVLTLNEIRCLLFCACIQYHKEVDIDAAGKIIDDAGYMEVWSVVVKALAACLPDKNEDVTPTQKKTKAEEK